MKRTLFVLALLAALSVASGSTSNASPVIGERSVAVSGWLSSYIVRYLGARVCGVVGLYEISSGGEAILGGDADDYANGREEKPGPDSNDLRGKGVLSTGGDQAVGSGSRTTIVK